MAITYRDITLKNTEKLDKKQDKRNAFRAVITDNLGNQSGSGSIWADQNARRIWVLPVGGVQPFQIICVKITPVIGLGVICGYSDDFSTLLEVLRTDYEFLGPSNTTGTAYESPSNLDFLPGGRLQLWIDGRMIQSLATYPDTTGLLVNVVNGEYIYGGVRVTFDGEEGIDLTSSVPGTPNQHRYVGLYLDSTNTIQTVDGTAVSTANTAPEPAWPAGAFELSMVLLANGQTDIDMTDIANKRIFSTDITSFAAGGWPFENVLTVSTTNTEADYSTIAAAITAAASSGDTIELDSETYSLSAQQAIGKSLTIAGQGPEQTIIDFDLANNACIDFTTDNTTIIFRDLTIDHSAGGSTAAGVLFTNNAGVTVILDNAIVRKSGGVPTMGYGAWWLAGTLELRNGSKLLCTSGTSQYGVINDSNADVTLIIGPGCEVGGATADVYSNRAGSVVTINGVLTNNLVDWAGTVQGRWENASGVQYAPESNDLFSAQTFRPNYIISPSVASNNLTVALKTMDGNDASASSPIVVRVGDAARVITAALSVTKNAGTNWCNSGSDELKTQDVDYFVYLIQESGASAGTKIGFSRIPYAWTMGDFVNTSTSEKYIAGSWTNFNSTDPVEVIGRFNATLSASASYNWSIGTAVVINRPIYVSRWLSYTPTVTSQTGTITTVGAVAGQYVVDYNKLTYNHAGAITTNGTGATSVRISLPFTVVGDNTASPGVDSGLTGNMLLGQNAGATINWFTYNGGYPGGSGANVKGGGVSMRLV